MPEFEVDYTPSHADHKDASGDPNVSFTPGRIHITDSHNLASMLRRLAKEQPRKVIIERKTQLGLRWVPVTTGQFEDEVRALARGLIALGIKPGDAIGIMSHTRYEWTLFDFAIWSVGAIGVPIYETSSTEQAEWIISDSNIRFVIAEDATTRRVVEPLVKKIKHFEGIFEIEDDAVGRITAKGTFIDDAEIDKRIDAMNCDDLATIIYTSGTTGKPKGVELTHRNLMHVAINGPLDESLSLILRGNARVLLFLPVAHVFARFITIMAIYSGAILGHSPDTRNLLADMKSFRPTFVLAVPRVFEKIYNAADAKAAKGAKQRIFRYYAKIAIEYGRALGTPEGPSPYLKMQQKVGDRLVYSQIKNTLGGRIKNAISGGAPLGERLGNFFRGIGLPVYEGYGLTETSAPTCVNSPLQIKVGTVGPAYPGCLVKIADDGEVLVKGDHVFRGYHNNPEATKESFTEDGWFRTGDFGSIDDEGFISITGRKKELIVTAGGKNVAPAILEDRLRGHPLVSQVVVVGDQKPFISALVTLDAEMLPVWLANHNIPPMSVSEAASNPQVLAALDRAVKRTNSAVSRAESIRKITVLTTDFSESNGYLTPSLKVRRQQVLADFADEVEAMYTK